MQMHETLGFRKYLPTIQQGVIFIRQRQAIYYPKSFPITHLVSNNWCVELEKRYFWYLLLAQDRFQLLPQKHPV